MDTGIWATWYNLADDTRDAYLEWAHGTYLPFLKQLPGYAWVAHYRHEGGGPKMKRVEETVVGHTDEDIGAGYQYVMLVGAPSAHTFFHPALSEIELPDSFRERLALRQGVRTAIFTEEARVSGPAAAQASPGSTPGPYIQMGEASACARRSWSSTSAAGMHNSGCRTWRRCRVVCARAS